MSEARSLLIELGTEELPPKALDALSEAFAQGVVQGLKQQGIEADLAHAHRYCSPRRLAVHIPAVAPMQPDQAIERRGPAVKAGLDADGQPTRALQGFAGSCGVGVDALETIETDKGAWYVYRAVQPGKALAELLPDIVAASLKQLPIPRPMRWADHDYAFVRPAHWLVMLHGADVIDAEIMELRSGRQTRGHRFHHPAPVHVADADAWLDALREAKVLADPAERRQRVRDEVARVAADLGGTPRLSDALLDEIANLTEWPVAIACAFEPEFLAVPPEALVTTMETNQKFVPVFGADGKLVERFIGVANIASNDPAEIRKGYERVIRPRFADAKFFYDEDLKTPLSGYQEALKHVTYQQALGSVWDKSVRVAELARVIANRVGVDAGQATLAAALSKCDLMTRMVGEFPELQGVMGRYYATAHGEPETVADALDAFYQPRHAGDAIAAQPLARVLAVAERLDTLAGIFAVGMKPSGNKDPFALRRAALGLARTLIEGAMDIDLKAALTEALQLLPDAALAAGMKAGKDGKKPALDAGARRTALGRELYAFVLDRLRGYYADQDVSTDIFEAVAAVAPSSLVDFDRRLRAVVDFAGRPQAASLTAANKRVGNLLRKQAEEGADAASLKIDPDRFEDDAERELAAALEAASSESAQCIEAGDYAAALARLAALQAPVDRFFDEILVMTEDADVRANRLALLAHLQNRFLAIADIARL
ncbi:glycine--tRNA ligase subunit beta [Oleiagrimonas sp. MCCC 1A03011]|uniref:glycine--tRNA ligase subunit beta n=1 Tax=Oleiagrimonas sp. MCCC 1A03011 TaxID=1926883 RepID=UPI000DC392A2|nr:glycine--tRNA ligase subunit beta [Oleiagrimonas sp. MCCC 1A03011]RAP56225.1 glycine--tRNA ligase subunit beta [Oleiagrimonas sp. MCCC 1A03011]